jgi:2-dehydro-3-deoxyphosphogluconate aldolase/(4S)-4-hydroxy-2-oxoglutarate aldolase
MDFPSPTFSPDLQASLRLKRIIAVTVIDDPADAAPLAQCLLDNGISAIELTLRTVQALECLSEIRQHCPEMLVGLGTVLTPAQVEEGHARGAAFAVAPGLNPQVIKAAQRVGLSFAPGITTPSELEHALSLGCRLLKFFPAEQIGGLRYLRAMNGPYAHLDLEFIPLGGLDQANFASYLNEPNIPAIGGSWIAPRSLIRERNWTAIERNAKAASEAAQLTTNVIK